MAKLKKKRTRTLNTSGIVLRIFRNERLICFISGKFTANKGRRGLDHLAIRRQNILSTSNLAQNHHIQNVSRYSNSIPKIKMIVEEEKTCHSHAVGRHYFPSKMLCFWWKLIKYVSYTCKYNQTVLTYRTP